MPHYGASDQSHGPLVDWLPTERFAQTWTVALAGLTAALSLLQHQQADVAVAIMSVATGVIAGMTMLTVDAVLRRCWHRLGLLLGTIMLGLAVVLLMQP